MTQTSWHPVHVPAGESADLSAGSRRTRWGVVTAAVGAVVAALIVGIVVLLPALSPALSPLPIAPFIPTDDDGMIPDGRTLSLDDTHPLTARLDPALAEALRAAGTEAALEGITFDVTSGWRSERLQQWLFDQAVETYRSEEVASEFVARPEDSSHVTGEAVDIASLDAQLWLIEHGARWGLCQTYANERWHFELATTPGGVCPAMLPDARSRRG